MHSFASSPALPAEACQLKPHRHLPDGALLNIKQQLAKSQWGPCSHAPSAHKQKGEIPDWRFSWLETFRDTFSAYSCSVLTLTSAELVLAGRSWVQREWIQKFNPCPGQLNYIQNTFPKKCYQKNKIEASSGVYLTSF